MRKHFNKKILMTTKDVEQFENSTKCQICNNYYADGDIKVRDHCHITGKQRSSAHSNCDIKVKLNHKIPIVFHNFKNYDSLIIMQTLDKFDLEMNVTPNALKKYVSFNIKNKLISLLIAFSF